MARRGLLKRARILAALRGDNPWAAAILRAIRVVTAVLVGINAFLGTAYTSGVLDVRGPLTLLGFVVILGAHAGMVWALLRGEERLGWHAALVLLLLVGIVLGILGAWEEMNHTTADWWPLRFLLSGVTFVVAASRGWGRTALLTLLFAFHLGSRLAAWRALGLPLDLDRAQDLAVELGQLALTTSLMLVIMAALLRAARFTDAAHRAAIREVSRASLADAREHGLREAERFVHDEVLHTLRTIAMDRRDVPTREAVAAAKRLDRLLGEVPLPLPAGTLAEQVAAAARELSLPIRLEVEEAIVVPPDVEVSLVLATMEALRNVQRHARAEHAVVRIGRAGLTAVVEVTDDGVGFDPSPGHLRSGIRSSILQRMRDVGGEATLASRPGEGTTVRLSWTPRHPESERFATSAGFGALAEFYPRVALIVVPYFAFACWSAAWLAGELARPAAGWLATVLLVAVGGTVAVLTLARGPRRWSSILLTAAAWGATVLNGWALPSGAEDPYLFWIVISCSAALVLQAMFRPHWAPVVTGAGLAVIAGTFTVARAADPSAVAAHAAAALAPAVAAGAYLGLRLIFDALAWEAYRAGEVAVRAQADAQLRAEFTIALTARMLQRRKALVDFVHGVATGALDATSPGVRATADSLERAARDRSGIAADLHEVAARMRERGHAVTVRVAESAPPEPQLLGAGVLEEVERGCPPGTTARVTVTVLPAAPGWRVAVTVVEPGDELTAHLATCAEPPWDLSRDPEFVQLSRVQPAAVGADHGP